ncbi:MAG TPA: hypothetical protein VM598_08765 [Bdellovibrionota bacterium]|nr:hypothetical protein [Bdellovibrionota bacterium]
MRNDERSFAEPLQALEPLLELELTDAYPVPDLEITLQLPEPTLAQDAIPVLVVTGSALVNSDSAQTVPESRIELARPPRAPSRFKPRRSRERRRPRVSARGSAAVRKALLYVFIALVGAQASWVTSSVSLANKAGSAQPKRAQMGPFQPSTN